MEEHESLEAQLARLREAAIARRSPEAQAQVDRMIARVAAEVVPAALRAGARAPDFTLEDTTGHPVRLSAELLSGPVVLAFYRGHW